MILRGGHGGDVFPVGKAQHGHFRPHHALFDDHGQTGGAELAAFHHVPHGLLGLLDGLRHRDALAQSQTVCLDHDGRTLLVDVGQSFRLVGEGLVLGGGDVVLGHQLLRKGFAGLDDGGVLVGAEGLDAGGLHGVHHAQSQGIIRRHHDQIHGVLFRPLHHGVQIGGSDGHTGGDGADAGVAGCAEQFGDFGALFQCPTDGVFTAAAADD